MNRTFTLVGGPANCKVLNTGAFNNIYIPVVSGACSLTYGDDFTVYGEKYDVRELEFLDFRSRRYTMDVGIWSVLSLDRLIGEFNRDPHAPWQGLKNNITRQEYAQYGEYEQRDREAEGSIIDRIPAGPHSFRFLR